MDPVAIAAKKYKLMEYSRRRRQVIEGGGNPRDIIRDANEYTLHMNNHIKELRKCKVVESDIIAMAMVGGAPQDIQTRLEAIKAKLAAQDKALAVIVPGGIDAAMKEKEAQITAQITSELGAKHDAAIKDIAQQYESILTSGIDGIDAGVAANSKHINEIIDKIGISDVSTDIRRAM